MSNLGKIRAILWDKIGSRLFACTPQNAYVFRTLMLKFFGMRCGSRVRVRSPFVRMCMLVCGVLTFM